MAISWKKLSKEDEGEEKEESPEEEEKDVRQRVIEFTSEKLMVTEGGAKTLLENDEKWEKWRSKYEDEVF